MLDELSHSITIWVTNAIPIATFLALAVTVFLFAKNKGTIDALKEATSTYKELADAYEKKIKALECDVEGLKKQVDELRDRNQMLKEATRIAIDEILDGFERHGFTAGEHK